MKWRKNRRNLIKIPQKISIVKIIKKLLKRLKKRFSLHFSVCASLHKKKEREKRHKNCFNVHDCASLPKENFQEKFEHKSLLRNLKLLGSIKLLRCFFEEFFFFVMFEGCSGFWGFKPWVHWETGRSFVMNNAWMFCRQMGRYIISNEADTLASQLKGRGFKSYQIFTLWNPNVATLFM